MAKQIDYAAMYTLRRDGRYMGYWHEPGREGTPTGKRHAIYDRDPERLYRRIEEKEHPEVQPVTFRQAAEAWEPAYRETITVRSWDNLRPHYDDLVGRWGDRPVAEISAADIVADLQRQKARGLSRTVVNGRKGVITGILNHALAAGDIPYNPALSVRLPKGLKKGRRSAPSDDVIKTVCASVDLPFGFFPFLLLCTGLRKSEALALTKADVDLEAREIRVDKALTYIDGANPTVKAPKSASGVRTVPVIEILAGPLRARCEAVEGAVLFPGEPSSRRPKPGVYMSERAYEGAWQRWCEAAGLIGPDGKPEITAHHLRHATATLLFEAGVDVYTAQRILGHATVQTTMEIYTELRDKQREKSVDKFNSALSDLLSDT